MTPPSNQGEAAYHRKAIRELLELVAEAEAGVDLGHYLAEAQVHSNLVIAEELRGLNEKLAEVIDPAAGARYPGVLRVRTEEAES